MAAAESEIELELSADQAWEKMRDFSAAINYVPGLTGLDITTEAREGVGASRRVYQGKRIVLDETVTEWLDGEGFTIRLHRGEKGPLPPMREAWFDYRLVQRDGRVFLHNCMRYELGLGFLGRWLDRVGVNGTVTTMVRDITLAQKLFYEGGQKVTPDMLEAGKAGLKRG